MKKVERIIYDKGDHVMVLSGYNKGMVGIVSQHDKDDEEVFVQLANSETVKSRRRNSYYDDDDDNDSCYIKETNLKYITKEEYTKGLQDNKILRIEGCPCPFQIKGKTLLIGDNVVTLAEAAKIASFINDNLKKKTK